ncbi:C-1-tetrahydrofolate synthase, cytoplasmic, putative [Trypanosoma equiperdum]|uniref:C-1-tetrahydrofolate synthase, cytoplasmic, putative n=2 Tax=Trypanozoon TaxID=39700 RepID=Q57WP0_TRYB2|nr:C-1-tetrahydrofolate synthase, cytoplasmic, putative [Trypanosoma brucei brucei TREU927]AAX69952.1 C-1-tetrahydrofolate synthase, cytoplasmic, putative [Trypanosoma brucei]AAZ12225.1 C-1-tetrahydrofolate synthase, cytoplasmic, putative [Trypanosoma brucei brucei TREU927]SCU71958.1 C-1-tetrahydrofolate synthase, cytoplasmic, putative [Trypanosoma equiperdum]
MPEAVVIDGRAVAKAIQKELTEEVALLERRYKGRRPGLSTIICGKRKDSQTYVRLKRKAAAACGFRNFSVELPANVTQETLEREVIRLNEEEACHSIVVQLPLPPHIDKVAALSKIKPEKDADCLLPVNVGQLHIRERNPAIVPCTASAVMELLRCSGVEICGKRVVVLGRGDIAGLPVATLLANEDATVTVVHSATPLCDIADIVRASDIVVSAAGQPGLVRGEWIKLGAAVIDVGTTPVADPSKVPGYRLVGDVCFDVARKRAAYITPVPGGVGPVTVSMLLKNTLTMFKRSVRAL